MNRLTESRLLNHTTMITARTRRQNRRLWCGATDQAGAGAQGLKLGRAEVCAATFTKGLPESRVLPKLSHRLRKTSETLPCPNDINSQ
jgi:hypothetical protein